MEAELEARFRSFNNKVKEANDKLDGLTPRVDHLGSELTGLERLIAEDLHQNAQASAHPLSLSNTDPFRRQPYFS